MEVNRNHKGSLIGKFWYGVQLGFGKYVQFIYLYDISMHTFHSYNFVDISEIVDN